MNPAKRSILAIAIYAVTLAILAYGLNWWAYDRAENKACLYTVAAMHYHLDSLHRHSDSLRRVILAQEQFFDRFLSGHWSYLPALEACRSSFRGYVTFNAAHMPELELHFTSAQIDSAYRAARAKTSVNVAYLPEP